MACFPGSEKSDGDIEEGVAFSAKLIPDEIQSE